MLVGQDADEPLECIDSGVTGFTGVNDETSAGHQPEPWRFLVPAGHDGPDG